MNNDPVSVIMPAYNAGKYISEAIGSVIQQTHTSWELIVIDDGSTDNTSTIVKEEANKDNRIRYVYQPQQGQGPARNKGLQLAVNEYVAFLDADDLWLPGKLEKQIEIMKTNNIDLAFSDAYVFENKLNTVKKFNIRPGYYSGKKAVHDFLSANHIPLLTALVKKSAIQKVNGFSGTQNIHEDYDLWLRMLINGSSFLGIDSPLAYYRVHASSSSGEGKLLFLDINTLQNIAALYPEYEKDVKGSIVHSINNYLAKNNISRWDMADRLITIKNNTGSEKNSTVFWKGIYKALGKNIFRMLFNLKTNSVQKNS